MQNSRTRLGTVIRFWGLAAAVWSSIVPVRAESVNFNVPSAPSAVTATSGKLDKPIAADVKEQTANSQVTETPDPATPLLVGAGLVAISLLRFRLRNKTQEE